MVAIFGSSPIPSHRIRSGNSAIFGIGNSAEMKVMPMPRARLESPIAKPMTTPAAVPRIQPVPIRMIDQDRWCQSAPESASCQIARTIADGGGRNSGLTRWALPASCQSPITSTSATQPAVRPVLGMKPPPRNSTGRVSVIASGGGDPSPGLARSSMLDLTLGFYSLFADQRPQLALQRQQLFAGRDVAALG